MPEPDGIEATRLIGRDEDMAGVKVLVLTTFEVDEFVVEALRAGASGFLGKGIEPAQLLDAIRLVAADEALLSPSRRGDRSPGSSPGRPPAGSRTPAGSPLSHRGSAR